MKKSDAGSDSHRSFFPEKEILKNTLIIGYGNPDRQDDGVAWHVLCETAKAMGMTPPDNLNEPFTTLPGKPEFLFLMQLVPELGEQISHFDRVCFVDAHTGEITEEVRANEITPQYQKSPFTHHMTPQTCLEITRTVYGKDPRALLVSIRGYEFGFEDQLSNRTAQLVPVAVKKISEWLGEE
jgi:hydrogenase maturation protease